MDILLNENELQNIINNLNTINNEARKSRLPVEILSISESINTLIAKKDTRVIQFSMDSAAQNELNYKKPWGKLDKQQKINRLMDYANKLETLLRLSSQGKVQLQLLIMNAVNERIITRKCDVDYCEQQGIILSIAELKFNQKTRTFYIGVDITDTKLKKTEAIPQMTTMKKIDLSNMMVIKTAGK